MSSGKEIDHLISLLDDPDLEVCQSVQESIISKGIPAIETLEEAWRQSENLLVAERLEEVILQIKGNQLIQDFADWWSQPTPGLKAGLVLYNRIIIPNYNIEEIDLIIKPIVSEIWLEINDQLTALEKVRIMNHLLFHKHQLQCLNNLNTKSKHLFLSNLNTLKQGHQLTISQLICMISRELQIPIYKVGSASIPALAYLDKGPYPAALDFNLKEAKPLFYLLPKNPGDVFGKKQFIEYLQHEYPTERIQLRQLSDKEFIYALLVYLKHSYAEEQNKLQHKLVCQLIAECK